MTCIMYIRNISYLILLSYLAFTCPYRCSMQQGPKFVVSTVICRNHLCGALRSCRQRRWAIFFYDMNCIYIKENAHGIPNQLTVCCWHCDLQKPSLRCMGYCNEDLTDAKNHPYFVWHTQLGQNWWQFGWKFKWIWAPTSYFVWHTQLVQWVSALLCSWMSAAWFAETIAVMQIQWQLLKSHKKQFPFSHFTFFVAVQEPFSHFCIWIILVHCRSSDSC